VRTLANRVANVSFTAPFSRLGARGGRLAILTRHSAAAAKAVRAGNESSSRDDVTDMTTDALRSRLDRTQTADARYAVKVQNGCAVRFEV
jgi:hypothetical protein